MRKKIRLLLSVISILITVTMFSELSFAGGNVLAGGDTGRNPFLGINFGGGRVYHYVHSGFEIELDYAFSDFISIAPRLGLADFNVVVPGVTLRFGIIQGIRPHGFWVGPGIDIFIWDDGVFIVPVGEFGWRYTFDFGLSLSPFLRLGAFFGDDNGFYLGFGCGVGYSF